jgi:hypothetical protein
MAAIAKQSEREPREAAGPDALKKCSILPSGALSH